MSTNTEEDKRRQNRESQQRWRENNRHKDRANARAWYQKNKEKAKASARVLPKLFKAYQYSAKRRGHEFALAFREFCEIIETAECFYCGERGEVGIDRFENTKGYTMEPGQCVPCCKWCNVAKSDASFGEMLDRVAGIVAKHGTQ